MTAEEIIPSDFQDFRECRIVESHPRDFIQQDNRLPITDLLIEPRERLEPIRNIASIALRLQGQLRNEETQLVGIRKFGLGPQPLQLKESRTRTPRKLFNQRLLPDTSPPTTRHQRRDTLIP